MPPDADSLRDAVKPDGTGARIAIQVSPRSSRAGLGPVEDGRLRVRVTAAAVEGAANAAVIRLLADTLGVAKSTVRIVTGETSRRKVLGVGLPVEEVLERLSAMGREVDRD